MKRGAGKRKGSEFERVVSRLLDVWWNVEEGTFWRSVNSGGWKEPADVSPRKSVWFPFVVECKFYKTISLLGLFKENSSSHLLRKWWAKLMLDVEKARQQTTDTKIGLLVFKYNQSPIFVCFELDTNGKNGLPHPSSSENHIILTMTDFVGGKPKTLLILPFTDFVLFYTKGLLKLLLNANGGNDNEGSHHEVG